MTQIITIVDGLLYKSYQFKNTGEAFKQFAKLVEDQRLSSDEVITAFESGHYRCSDGDAVCVNAI